MRVEFKRAGSVLAFVLALGLASATQAAAAKSHSCGGGGLLGSSTESFPVELPGGLEAPVLASYGVFRRPQRAADMLPPVNPAGGELEYELSGYYASEIRQVAALPNGERFFVIPGLPRVFNPPPLRCFPRSLRKRIEKFAEEERKRQTEPRYCVIEVGARRGLSSSACGAFAEVASARRIFSFSLFGPPTTAMLVPDGVASVRIVGPGKRQTTIPVSENAFLYAAPRHLVLEQRRLLHRLFTRKSPKHPTKAQRRHLYRLIERTVRTITLRTEPSKVEWLGPGGILVKSISRPPVDGAQASAPISTG
ncbi:MAG TPA: hypothetical protein VF927_02130 [Solirubrobacteraceae bacterium]